MIVFALRHADRTATGDDLSPAGRKQALLLARMLAEGAAVIVFRSDAVRAARTVEPLKQKLSNALIVKEVGFEAPTGSRLTSPRSSISSKRNRPSPWSRW